MSFTFSDVDQLTAAMNRSSSQTIISNAIDSAIADRQINELARIVPITTTARAPYTVDPRFDKTTETTVVDVSCDASINVVRGDADYKRQWYVPAHKRIAIRLCRMECGSQTFPEKLTKAAREEGASIASYLFNMFWQGDYFNSGVGANVNVDKVALTPYKEADELNPVKLANMLMRLARGSQPGGRWYMGPLAAELLGYRLLGTGDGGCSEVWDCMIERLRSRTGVQNPVVTTHDYLDRVTGLPGFEAEEKAAIVYIAPGRIEMGYGNPNFTKAHRVNHDSAEKLVEFWATGARVLQEGGAAVGFDFITQSKIDALDAGTYGDTTPPSLTAPFA